MIRLLAAIATLLSLSGCVTTEYVYRDRYYDRYDGYAYDDDGYYERRVYRDGSAYSRSYAGRGDYYYSMDYGWSPSYYDYPAYYSLFWPMRSWYDPYWYPGYYYGVTFFPRHYGSFAFSYGWPHYSHWYYSPYRYSWADNYYDWRPWYGGGRHYNHYAPRFGSARNEAERLSRRADAGWDYGRAAAFRDDRNAYRRDRDERVSDAVRRTPYGTYGTTRDPMRDADYGTPSSPRRDIGQRGFGVPDGQVRRQDPGTRGFGVPAPTRETSGYTSRSGEADSMRELRRQSYEEGLALPGSGGASAGYQRYSRDSEAMRESRARRGYDAGEAPRGGWTQPQRSTPAREYSQREYAPARSEIPVARDYDGGGRYQAPAREYDGGGRFEAPARGYDNGARATPSFSAPSQPSYSAPEPSYRESPRFESSRDADFGRSESRSDGGSRGEVRRVGNNRDE
jgi:hypothetical protein